MSYQSQTLQGRQGTYSQSFASSRTMWSTLISHCVLSPLSRPHVCFVAVMLSYLHLTLIHIDLKMVSNITTTWINTWMAQERWSCCRSKRFEQDGRSDELASNKHHHDVIIARMDGSRTKLVLEKQSNLVSIRTWWSFGWEGKQSCNINHDEMFSTRMASWSWRRSSSTPTNEEDGWRSKTSARLLTNYQVLVSIVNAILWFLYCTYVHCLL